MAQKTAGTFAELKAAAEDADTTEILLTADITFTSGIRIPVAKKSLTIKGQNHTVTDMNSSSATDALYVPSGVGTAVFTVENVVWSGRNYYGVVCVQDDSANAGVSVVLQNVKYTGPQMIYNRYGTTTVDNCAVNIEKNGASANPQEFCEANRLILSGKVSVTSLSSSTAVMWFAFAGAAITVAQNASVTITAPNTYLIYSDTAAKPKLNFMHSSSTVISVKNGLFYAAGTGAHIASSCTIEEGAALSVTSAAANGVPIFKCAGDFSVMKNGSLSIISPQSGSSPLIYFSVAAKATFYEPKSVLLYSNGGKVFSFASGSAASPNTVSVTAGQINYWTKSTTPYSAAGGFDDLPTTAVYKTDKENVSAVQTLGSNAVIGTTSNLSAGDGGYPLGTANYDLTKATVFSAGTLPLTINAVNDLASAVGGTTAADAAIRVIDAERTVSATADENGVYSVALERTPNVGEVINVWANKNFLTEKNAATVTGSVTITSLPDIPFNAIGTPRYSAPLNRINPNWEIELTDTRANGGKWALYVLLESELQSEGEVIAEAVTFTDESTAVIGAAQMLVASGETTSAQKIYVSWEQTKGILLDVAENTVFKGGKYIAKLKWSAEFE